MARLLYRAAAAACAVICLDTGIALAQTSSKAEPRDRERPSVPIDLPLSFEEIGPGADAGARFLARSRDYTFLLTDTGAMLEKRGAAGRQSMLRISFAGQDPMGRLVAADLLPGKVYYATRDLRGALRGRSTFGRVRERGLYPGIDLL